MEMSKKVILSALVYLLLSSGLYSQRVLEPLKIVSDLSYSYKWDRLKQEWAPSTYQKYSYNESGTPDITFSYNSESGEKVTRQTFVYNENDVLMEYFSERWLDSVWIFSRKDIYSYDDQGNRTGHKTIIFKDGMWLNATNRYKYEYEDNKVVSMTSQGWEDSLWVDTGYEIYDYNISGNLILSQGFDMSGNRLNRVFYFNNEENLRTSMLVQGWSRTDDVWRDIYRDSYEYNNCNKRVLSLRERYSVADGWLNENKSEYFYKALINNSGTHAKVAICHNGHTIYVSVNAVEAHLNHGDCLGSCDTDKPHMERNREMPFKLYPNPAKDFITIRFDNNYCEGDVRIELVDSFGKIQRSYIHNGNGDLVIRRAGLHSGSYFLRIVGEEVYNTIVIFE